MRIKLQECLIYFCELLTNFTYTMTISYFPSIALNQGMNQSILAIFFALDALVGLPISLLAGKYMNQLGRKQVFLFGLITAGISLLLLGQVRSSSYEFALILSILSRLTLGVGLGCYLTAGPAMLLNSNIDEADRVIAYFEASAGLGLLLGPTLGYLINSSFIGCFNFTSFIYFSHSIICYFFLNESNTQEQSQTSSSLNIIKKPVSSK